MLDLFAYFDKFKNEDGLLESLESWVFVEWSAANKFVQDVNYPSNMLYTRALEVAGEIYGLDSLISQAKDLRNTIREQSFDGSFFVDNAKRENGELHITTNRSEVCQYFAFFFDVASPETHGELWKVLRDEFGPHRKETKAYPEVHEANSFIGNMLRVELLSRQGLSAQILDESIAFLSYMEERTGTLWENVHAGASCNHGFASHVVHTLYRDVLGVRELDAVNKSVRLRFSDVGLSRCEGVLPTPDGTLTLRWEKDANRIRYHVETPPGYAVLVDRQPDGLELVAGQ